MYMESEMRDELNRVLILLTGIEDDAVSEAHAIVSKLLGYTDEEDEITEDDLQNEVDWGYGDDRAMSNVFHADEYFQGDVWVSFKTHNSGTGGYTDCELRIFNTKGSAVPYTWWVQIVGKTYTNAKDVLEELKKEEYINQGASQA